MTLSNSLQIRFLICEMGAFWHGNVSWVYLHHHLAGSLQTGRVPQEQVCAGTISLVRCTQLPLVLAGPGGSHGRFLVKSQLARDSKQEKQTGLLSMWLLKRNASKQTSKEGCHHEKSLSWRPQSSPRAPAGSGQGAGHAGQVPPAEHPSLAGGGSL